MGYTKKRVRQHLMEDLSIRVVRDLLPAHWVVREYRPDYGIDLTVELFDFVDEAKSVAATLGETLFVQVKSTEVVEAARLRVYGRRNVERGGLRENRAQSTEIDVARLRLETSELLTVQAIGSAIPVLLFLVELSTRRIYFVCLNDLLEKVVIPHDPAYGRQRTRAIQIPLANRISAENPASLLPLGTFAKRPKLYAAFTKFAYQRHEAEIAWEHCVHVSTDDERDEAAEDVLQLIRHFLAINLRFDFWGRMPEWAPIGLAERELSALSRLLSVEPGEEAIRAYLATQPGERLRDDYLRALDLDGLWSHLLSHVVTIWRRLDNLSRIYEEMVREWFLPTHLSSILSQDLRMAVKP